MTCTLQYYKSPYKYKLWLLRIAEHEDRTVNLRHIMDFGFGHFDIHIVNTDQVVHTMRELVPVAGMLV